MQSPASTDTDPQEGDAIEVTTVTVTVGADEDRPETTSSVWHFDLKQVVRDQDSNTQTGAGIIDDEDVEVVVDGTIQVVTRDFVIGWVANGPAGLRLLTTTAPTLMTYRMRWRWLQQDNPVEDPSDGFENVVINYEYSEYEFGAETPIRLAGTSFFHGKGRLYRCEYPGQHRHRRARQHSAH